MNVFDYKNRNTPEYHDMMYQEGYSSEQIL